MDIKDFILNFANQFDDTELSEFTPETNFREMDEWSSLVGLAVLNMITKKYKVSISSDEMKKAIVIADLYALIVKKTK